MEYENRKGNVYYLQAGKTRTGKPRYWCTRKPTAEPLNAMPAGFEFREDPASAIVTLRRIQSTEISPLEIELLSAGLRSLAGLEYFIVDVEGDALVVYLPNTTEHDILNLFSELGDLESVMSTRMKKAKASMMARSAYTKMMRFELVDSAERSFVVQRWCFRGAIDDWIRIGGPAPLPKLVDKYAPHLGQESFYELI